MNLNTINNRGKYDMSLSDYMAIMLITLVIVGQVSAWWLFLLLLCGRFLLILDDISEEGQRIRRNRIAYKKMVKEKQEKGE